MKYRSSLTSVLASLILTACAGATPDTSHLARGNNDEIGRYLSPDQVPGRVKRAVADVTRLGRVEGDFFGFQRLDSYTLVESAAEPRLTKILADVIEATRRHGDYSVADFCMKGLDSEGRELKFDDDNECAFYLAGNHKKPRVGEVFGSVRQSYIEGSEEARQMTKAMNDIQAFIGRQVGGSDQEEISVSMDGLNISEETVILINKRKGHVVLVKFDYGA